MTDQVSVTQTLHDGSVDSLELNRKGVVFKRVYVSRVEQIRHYSHQSFYQKLKSAEKEFELSGYKAQAPDCFHLRYTTGFDTRDFVLLNHVLQMYVNGDVSSYEFPFGKRYHKLYTALVIVWLCCAIVSVFTFFIPLFNSLVDYRYLISYVVTGFVVSYMFSLFIYRPGGVMYSRKRMLGSLVVGGFLVGQVATLYRLLNTSSYMLKGKVEYYYLSEDYKGSSQNEYGVYARLDNGKQCFFRLTSDVNGKVPFTAGTQVNCEFKTLMPGIDILVSRRLVE